MPPKQSQRGSAYRKWTSIWILVMMVFISQLLIYAWCRVQNVRRGYEIMEVLAEQRRLLAVRETLKVELARLKSPGRIARIAREQFGLVSPGKQQTIDME
ncbi:MAG: cell division protein FtsL [Desulfobacterales bacterium]|jgi:cell division protein FtsB|nr:cell division protein FtsL [Desulfobacterales bacterium]